MNQMPISECYFTQIQHITSLSQTNSIHKQSQTGISTQNGISNSGAFFTCNTCNWNTRFYTYQSTSILLTIILLVTWQVKKGEKIKDFELSMYH